MAATIRTSQRVMGFKPGDGAGAGDDTGQLSVAGGAGWDWVRLWAKRVRSNRGLCRDSPLPRGASVVTMSASRLRLPAATPALTPETVASGQWTVDSDDKDRRCSCLDFAWPLTTLHCPLTKEFPPHAPLSSPVR